MHISGIKAIVQRNPALRLAKNTSLLLAANLVYRLGSIVLISVMARQWGKSGVAEYVLSMSWGGYTIFLADLGLSVLSVRMLSSAAPAEKPEILGRLIVLKLIASPLLLVAVVIAWAVLPYALEVRISIIIVGLGIATSTYAQVFFGAFRSVEHMEYEALLMALSSIIWLAAGVSIVVLGGGVLFVAVAFLVIQVLVLGAVAYLSIRRLVRPILAKPAKPAQILKESIPFGITSLVARGYTEMDIQMLSFFVSATLLGAYSAAARLVVFASLLPVYVSQAVFPVASRLWAQRRYPDFKLLYDISIRYQFAFSLLLTALLIVLSDVLTRIIFGPQFESSAETLRILALVIPLKYISQAVGNALEASGKQHVRSMVALGGIGVALPFNFLLISRYGVSGAALAVIFSEMAMLSVMLYMSRRDLALDWSFWRSLLVLTLAGVLVYAVGSQLATALSGWGDVVRTMAVSVSMSVLALVLFGLSQQIPGWRTLQELRRK